MSTATGLTTSRRGLSSTRVQFACGVAYFFLYIPDNDVVAATIYDGSARW